ncbi:hypothetical protein [Clostridium aminobutyricum]|uniref:Lipoprotein n=1 Tax=Clostridium aminobutyricum TaxID=33953 RepID=A0A939D6B6_CLOAM|nr:hypothetical protein [Clostridium aminobutyricum]MBN7772022.1 hypothetical protein [Clostridium aminobutyricum]
MKKARILLGLLLIMVMVAFSGCGNNNPTTIDPDTPGNTTNGGIVNDDNNRDGILNDDDNNGILDNDRNNVNPLNDTNTTDGSISNKANTPDNQ